MVEMNVRGGLRRSSCSWAREIMGIEVISKDFFLYS